MKKPLVWLMMAAVWLSLALVAMWLVTRPVTVKAGPVGSIHASMIRPEVDDWFSAYPAGHRLIHGQEPVEPSGNPDHVEPTMDCGNVFHEGRMIACECHKWKSCDDDPGTERRSCKSYCWAKTRCRCVKECD